MPTIMEDIEYLSQEIGPRPSGTEEEQQAALYIADQIQKRTGFAATIEDFAALNHPGIVEAICFGATALFSLLAIISRVFVIPAFLIGVVCALLYAFELMDRPLLSRFFERGVSQNVVARYTPGSRADQRGRKVVLVANYDSSKVQTELSGVLLRIYPFLVKGSAIALVVLPAIWLIRSLFLLHATGGAVSALTLIAVVAIVFALVPVIVFVMHKLATYNEAANNNAAGVAALIEVARIISEGSVPEEEIEALEAAHLHDEEAAYAADVVVEGAQLEYAPGVAQSDRERLAAAKAAVAALTGQPLREYVNEDVVSYITTTPTDEALEQVDYGEYGYMEPGGGDAVGASGGIVQTEEGAPEYAGADMGTGAVSIAPPSFSAGNEPSWFTAGRAKAAKPAGADDAPVRRSRYADALEVALEASQAHIEEASRVLDESAGVRDGVAPRTFAPEGEGLEIDAHESMQELFSTQDTAAQDSALGAAEAVVEEEPAQIDSTVAFATDQAFAEGDRPSEPETGLGEGLEQEADDAAVAPIDAQNSAPEMAEAERQIAESQEIRPDLIYLDEDQTEEASESVEANAVIETQPLVEEEPIVDAQTASDLVVVEEEPIAVQQELKVDWQEDLRSVPEVDVVLDVAEQRPVQPKPLVSVMMTDEELELLNGATTKMQPIDVSSLREGGVDQPAAEEQTQDDDTGDATYDFSQITNAPRRRYRDITLPSIGNTGKLVPIVTDPAPEDMLVREQDSKQEAREKRAALRSVIPSLSGEFTPLEVASDEENSEVSKTGSFAAVGSAAAFEPVGDELVADLAPEERYIDDADDSTFDDNVTETGALTGPDYVDMPESRLSRFFSRFRKKQEEEQSTAEWLDVDENFDAREVGAARGSWESFRNDDDVQEGQVDQGAQDGQEGNGRVWHGGAFSSKRAQEDSGEEDSVDAMVEPVSDDIVEETEGESDENAVDVDDAALADQVAVETALIHNFRNPDINTEVWFVALGSEYASNGGMKAFLDEHADELRGAIIINMEALGAGEVCFVEEEGLVFPKRPSSRMKRFLRKASEVTGIKVGAAKISWRDSAASVAMKRGLQAMTLAGMDGAKPALLGQGDDVMENVDEQMVRENAQFVLEFIKNI